LDRAEYLKTPPKYLAIQEKDCTLKITDLRENDSAEYKFRFKTQHTEWGYSFPGTTLTVTGNILFQLLQLLTRVIYNIY
jgi:WD40 repeat protein